MKKVVILTASTGGGHNQAAKALKSIYESYGYQVTVIDFLKVKSKAMDKLFVEGYEILSTNLPVVYRGIYKYSNNKQVNARISKYITKLFEKRVYKAIKETNPKLIIGTHPFIVNVICKLKEKGKLKIPFISVITDFKAHRIYVNDFVDAYITASEYTSSGIMKEGISKDKIFNYGLPIKKEFLNGSYESSKKCNKVFTILLMGGSMGVKGIEDVLKGLIRIKNKKKIIVVCGNNKSMMENIKSKYEDKFKCGEITIYGFTEEIPVLMEKADVLISKPGGLTVSEAIAKKLPMIIPYMLPGQEEENAEFLVGAGTAKIVRDINKIDKYIVELLENPMMIKNMKENMERLSKDYSLDSIVELGENLIDSYSKNYYKLKKAK